MSPYLSEDFKEIEELCTKIYSTIFCCFGILIIITFIMY
jgi:hypothetical protein